MGKHPLQKHLLGLLAGWLTGSACVAAAPATSTASNPPGNTLTVAMTRHQAVCPPPAQAPCPLRKPVSTPYRLLTPGIDLEDFGDYWLLTSGKGQSSAPVILRVLDNHGHLHEVSISFSTRPAPRAKAAAKSP